MQKSLFLAPLVALGLGASAPAAQIVVNNFDGFHPITDQNENPLSGGFVAVGYFTGITDAEIGNTTNATLGALDAAFTQFGDATTFASAATGNTPGFFSANIGEGTPAGAPAIGQRIYLVAGDGSGIADSNYLAVFGADEATGPTFPEDNPAGSESFILDSIVVEGRASLLLGDPVSGIPIPTGGTANGTAGAFVGIPEPSTGVLALLGGLAFLRRKRRS